MDIGAIFILLALLILVVLYLAQPYMERNATLASEIEVELSELLAERDNAINALKELEFDYELGKIPEGDYPAQRATLMNRGAEALRRLDEYHAGGDATKLAEDRVESAIDAHKGERQAEDDLEALISARRSKRKGRSSGFCPNCGHPILSNDKFCTSCGKKTS